MIGCDDWKTTHLNGFDSIFRYGPQGDGFVSSDVGVQHVRLDPAMSGVAVKSNKLDNTWTIV